ncbi:MAG TPA: diguanylate cyclase [Conexibacter sp.]|nr:diguanylate cyclase [Conexibacter sp.]
MASLPLARRARGRGARRADAELRAIFETAPIGHLVLDCEDRIVLANPALERIVGAPRHMLTSCSLDALVHPEDLPLLRIVLAELRHDVCATLETEIRLRPLAVRRDPVPVAVHAAVLEPGGRGPRRVLLQVLDATERKRAEAQLQHMADHDPLTGLLNRRSFERELERHIAHMRRYGAEGAAIVLDVDRFKPVNDTYGHGAGDRLIVRVAELVRARLRTTDAIARLGGDEFAILLPKADRAGAEAVAHSLVETVRAEAGTDGDTGGPITISVGVAMLDEHPAPSTAAIIAAADLAMYEAKRAGRNGYAVFVAPAPKLAI